MKFTGNYYFDADQETVWNLMMDPNAIAAASPGVDKLIPLDGEENAWRADAKIGIAMISGTYSGTIHLSDINSTDDYRITVKGEGQRSIINGTAIISLTYDEGLEQTIVSWDADADVSGKLASIGQRVFKAAANMISKQFFRALAKQLPAK